MKTTKVALLLFICCLFALLNTNDAGQADRLRELIKSRRTSNSIHGNSWTPDDATGTYLPMYIGPQDGLMKADKIDKLPGQPHGVKFDQYAGYVTVDPKAGRALFYYFVESPQESATKPLVLWLNGGPGCSSFGYGAMEELGPFRVNSDGKTLKMNDYAWNNVANVLFLESPAGVGFSYSNTTSDYTLNGDKRTAEDAYTFLINWLERFPQYKTRDFFITGESYAGHYVPQLAFTIDMKNKISKQTIINLKGIAIGNAYVDANVSTKATYDFFWSHALISDESHTAILLNCIFSNGNLSLCLTALEKADGEIGGIDFYNIYAPLCHSPSKENGPIGSVNDFDPCSDNYVQSYLNLVEVQKALHANVTMLPYQWVGCRGFIWNDRPATVLPTIKYLIERGIRVWMYSGDTDSVVSVTDTKYSINVLGLSIETSWRPWYTNSEVGGYVVGYKGLTFATIRGAGHLVPSYQPERALTMFSSFLQGKLPPSS